MTIIYGRLLQIIDEDDRSRNIIAYRDVAIFSQINSQPQVFISGLQIGKGHCVIGGVDSFKQVGELVGVSLGLAKAGVGVDESFRIDFEAVAGGYAVNDSGGVACLEGDAVAANDRIVVAVKGKGFSCGREIVNSQSCAVVADIDRFGGGADGVIAAGDSLVALVENQIAGRQIDNGVAVQVQSGTVEVYAEAVISFSGFELVSSGVEGNINKIATQTDVRHGGGKDNGAKGGAGVVGVG